MAQPAGLPARLAQTLLSPWSRFGLLLVLLGTAVTLVLVFEPQRVITDGSLAQLSGVLSVLLFAAAYGTCTTAFLPRPFLNLAAGALFGAQLGLGAALAGTAVGAGISFGLGRLLGQDALRPLLKHKLLTKADRQLSRHGFRTMLVMRLLPGIPFAGSNFTAAVSRMSWPAFLSATILGSVPNTAAYVVAGSQASTPSSPAFLIAFGFIGLSGVGGAVFAWRKRVEMRAATARAAGTPQESDETPDAGGARGQGRPWRREPPKGCRSRRSRPVLSDHASLSPTWPRPRRDRFPSRPSHYRAGGSHRGSRPMAPSSLAKRPASALTGTGSPNAPIDRAVGAICSASASNSPSALSPGT
ncbi:hypothetical protein N566_26400 [Streptomycetaceae bacterium MP113-05]|nr:hypothetical protein N566_26400 [Streptomycetaceae bacterium MP113-05]